MAYIPSSSSDLGIPPPHTRPSSHVVDKAKLIKEMESKTPIGKLAELSWLFKKEEPRYIVHTIIDDIHPAHDTYYFTSTVEFAGQEFESLSLRAGQRDAMEDAASLAFNHFLTISSIIPYPDIPKRIPTISPILALEALCQENDWTLEFIFEGLKGVGWWCSICVGKYDEIVVLEEGEMFLSKRNAKIDAAAAMYDKLFEELMYE